jgi:hypothetical protein
MFVAVVMSFLDKADFLESLITLTQYKVQEMILMIKLNSRIFKPKLSKKIKFNIKNYLF